MKGLTARETLLQLIERSTTKINLLTAKKRLTPNVLKRCAVGAKRSCSVWISRWKPDTRSKRGLCSYSIREFFVFPRILLPYAHDIAQ